MKTSRAKKQLRRCQLCLKVGHNKSTCPDSRGRSTRAPRANQTLKFFVHHVAHAPTASPHVINLKTEAANQTWNKIATTTPTTPEPTAFHAYHTFPNQPPSAPAEIIPPLPRPSRSARQSGRAHPPHFASASGPARPSHLARQSEPTADPTPIVMTPPTTAQETVNKILLATPATPEPTIEQLLAKPPEAGERTTLPVVAEPTRRQNFLWKEKVLAPTALAFTASLHTLRQKLTFSRLTIGLFIIALLAIVPSSTRGYYASLRTTAGNIAADSTAGFMALAESTAALKNADVTTAQAATERAVKNFNDALDTLENNHTFLQTIVSAIPVVNEQVISRQKIILAGQEIAIGNSYLLTGIKASAATPSTTLAERLDTIVSYLQAAIPNYALALENLEAVDSTTVPLEYQSQFTGFRTLLKSAVHDFQNMADIGTTLHDIFGNAGKRRYLVVFQNQHELRPTGGFMGSFAVVDVKDGKIVKWELPAGGSYDIQGQLPDYLIPPTPMLLSNKRWQFHDANWFPDFPASAEKMLWFYRRAGGVSADGVIAVNASVLERLLAIMGPITDEKRAVTLTAENVLPTIQTIVETGPEKKLNKPKQVLTDLAPTFISYFENIKPESLLPLLSNLEEALAQKEIQMYFTDPPLQKTVESFGWGGRLLETKQTDDYLLVVNANFQGEKSDARIKQTIAHEAQIQPDGSIIDTVTITRAHTGRPEEKLYGQTNIDYLRLYVPAGSRLLSAQGFTWPDESAFKTPESWYTKDQDLEKIETEIGIDAVSGTRLTNEFGKTAFGNWVITEPGATSVVQFTYQLPFRLPLASGDSDWKQLLKSSAANLSSYRLIAQKQSGITSDFESQIIFPTGWGPTWYEGTNVTAAANGIAITPIKLKTDTTWAVILKK